MPACCNAFTAADLSPSPGFRRRANLDYRAVSSAVKRMYRSISLLTSAPVANCPWYLETDSTGDNKYTLFRAVLSVGTLQPTFEYSCEYNLPGGGRNNCGYTDPESTTTFGDDIDLCSAYLCRLVATKTRRRSDFRSPGLAARQVDTQALRRKLSPKGRVYVVNGG